MSILAHRVANRWAMRPGPQHNPWKQSPASLKGDLETLHELATSKAVGPAKQLGVIWNMATMALKGVRAEEALERARKAFDSLGHTEKYLIPRTVIDLIHQSARAASKEGSSRLTIGPGKADAKTTALLQKAKLVAKNRGDFDSALRSAAFNAKRFGATFYVYSGNSYMHQVWRVSQKASDYQDPINNTGFKVVSVTPDLVVSYHDVDRG